MFKASRSEDGNFILAGHPTILGMLLSIPATLRSVIEDPENHKEANQRLFPKAYADHADDLEYTRLVGEDRKNSARAKIAVFEKTLLASDAGQGAISIPHDHIDPFLSVLNDLRLLLAIEIGIEDESWEETLDESSFEDSRITIFHILGAIQHHLLDATGMVDFEIEPDEPEE